MFLWVEKENVFVTVRLDLLLFHTMYSVSITTLSPDDPKQHDWRCRQLEHFARMSK